MHITKIQSARKHLNYHKKSTPYAIVFSLIKVHLSIANIFFYIEYSILCYISNVDYKLDAHIE